MMNILVIINFIQESRNLILIGLGHLGHRKLGWQPEI